ncbi:peptidase S10, serine carboxypeptidase [Sistotremastrum niveocremeum HHB9708]|uniref:Carboxypeptidase n=1 Tax=Sistotremastrum niveocremeum HHB9708 TaxID=1314777 RepID=A0A164ZK72_9AGAM|nr:peptidase S10, serine carboxypeptidase [Sistotremastrum niveocremeum HHB9708]
MVYRSTCWLVVSAALAVVQAFSTPFRSQSPSAWDEPHLRQSTETHLSSLSDNNYSVFSHPLHPDSRIRVKRSDWCDPTVHVYTGYLDVDYGTKHLWFYFFESRSSPDTDDVVMWINGGPGCSSSVGLLMELGPCSIDMDNFSPNGTVWNPYGWNDNANIFFLDQPVGVGYSYADHGKIVGTTEEAARNVASFLEIWFEAFPQFAGRKLHLSGESYGGRYLPVFASEVVDRNQIAKAEGRPTLNLQSVLIGNGITDISTLYPGRYAVECGSASLEIPFQSISTCVRIKTALPRCQEWMESSCITAFDEINCRAAIAFCDAELSTPLRLTGRNPYDISKPCVGSLCYAESDKIVEYLNANSTRELLGVEISGNITSCSSEVGRAFALHMDKYAVPTQYYIAGLLDRGIRVLIYAGTYDWQCNWVANYLWTEKLEWSHAEAYKEVKLRDWKVDGNIVGETKSVGGLTFATIRGAGHMVPHDKPAESLEMLNKWLRNEKL